LKPRFQADNDLDNAIRKGVLRREPAIDFQSAQAASLDSTADLDVLRRAAEQGRIVISHDVTTMPIAFAELVESGLKCPGIFLVPQSASVRDVVEGIVLIWLASEAAEWDGRIVWLPM
jgi:hypothetical protein